MATNERTRLVPESVYPGGLARDPLLPPADDPAPSYVVCRKDGAQRLVVKRDGWWIVLDAKTHECLSGGFKRASEAKAEARS